MTGGCVGAGGRVRADPGADTPPGSVDPGVTLGKVFRGYPMAAGARRPSCAHDLTSGHDHLGLGSGDELDGVTDGGDGRASSGSLGLLVADRRAGRSGAASRGRSRGLVAALALALFDDGCGRAAGTGWARLGLRLGLGLGLRARAGSRACAPRPGAAPRGGLLRARPRLGLTVGHAAGSGDAADFEEQHAPERDSENAWHDRGSGIRCGNTHRTPLIDAEDARKRVCTDAYRVERDGSRQPASGEQPDVTGAARR